MANFATKNKGTWFYFNEDNPELGGVCLRDLTVDEATRIDKDTTEIEYKSIRGARQKEEKKNAELAWKMIQIYRIVDWKCVEFDEKPVECTAENKVRAMKINDFHNFVMDKLDILRETNVALEQLEAEKEEDRGKNSGSTSSGNQKS